MGKARCGRPRSVTALASLVVTGLLSLQACTGCDTPPEPPITRGIDPADHVWFPIADDAVHALGRVTADSTVACSTCHANTNSFKEFTCVGCHEHESIATNLLHSTTDEYAYESPRCYSCHPAGVQRPPFDHVPGREQCATCHDAGAAFAALPVQGFEHPNTFGNDCGSCHFSFDTWENSGVPVGLVADPNRAVVVDSLIPAYAGTSIVSLSPLVQTLDMPMNHFTAQIPPEAQNRCVNCHAEGSQFYPGRLHSSLENLALSAPSQCTDCHASSVPTGFVGALATDPPRDPASGEMKHDAVAWVDAVATTSGLVPVECALCHLPPTIARPSTWAGSHGPAVFHDSLDLGGLPQPDSCLDCHANSRPNAAFSAADAPLPVGVTFDHRDPLALGDCISCHAASATARFADGRFHNAADATPSSCLPCHEGERPTSTETWQDSDYENAPFDFVTNDLGIPHGAGQDCVLCHASPGTGAWGVNQNWQNGFFSHTPGTVADSTCIACHSGQRADLVVANAAALLGFDHTTSGAGDCVGCHQASLERASFAHFFNPATGTLPGGDWAGGVTYPGAFPIGSGNRFITVSELVLQRGGLRSLVLGTSSTSEILFDQMLHTSTVLPSELAAGLEANPETCWHCHTNDNGVVTSLINGVYHDALAGFRATPNGPVTPKAQPTSNCADCHTAPSPQRIVQKDSSLLQPMDHGALFVAAVTIDGASVNGVAAMDCSSCHASPGEAWSDGRFHASIGAAVPADCTQCHYPAMASPSADVVDGTEYSMRHASPQLPFQNCQTCHADALARATQTPLALAQWAGGTLHPNLSPQPTACIECHARSSPPGLTQSDTTYALVQGRSATNEAQWMNHLAAEVIGQDCVRCHAADARALGSAWQKSTPLHPVVTTRTCASCHGTGAVGGTQNNLPVGLIETVTTSSAAGVAATGVPAGTRDQLTHADLNVSRQECNFCHTQTGSSTASGVSGSEWAQASFHVKFSAANPLVVNDTTARCSNCHLNVKPGPAYPVDHTSFSDTPGSVDCSSCHAWPGTGTATSPNWRGAVAGAPPFIAVGGFLVPQPPADNATTVVPNIPNLPHPDVATGTSCATCHGDRVGKNAVGYDHASPLIVGKCVSCHEAGSNLVGAVWNDAAALEGGAGDTRPFTVGPFTATTSAYPGRSLQVEGTNHFYPIDCTECHDAYEGALSVPTSGAAYRAMWSFPHDQSRMTAPDTCIACHGENGLMPPDLVNDPLTSIQVSALLPTYSGTSILTMTPDAQTLPMSMDHLSTAIDPAAMTSCANCHVDAQTFYPGNFHSALANLVLPNPTLCADCHITSVPTGFVGPLATDPPRNPASGEMKHDAVVWTNDAPTATPLVALECSTCHEPPSADLQATWARGSAAPVFHDALTAALLPQPSSCIDCHANSRPAETFTSTNAPSLAVGVSFDHTRAEAMGDCTSCHESATYDSFANARFHLVGDTDPTTCLPCHEGERPTSTATWLDPGFRDSPFDFVTNAAGIEHGAGQDCVQCHASSGTGQWGINQNWQNGFYDHDPNTVAGASCIACHSTQRADLVAANAATLLGFDHARDGTGDCIGCHQQTVLSGSFQHLFNPATGALPGGDWAGGIFYPGDNLVGSPTEFVTVAEITLVRSGTRNLVTSTTSTRTSLYNQMLHTSAALPTSINAGPANNPDETKCWHCHTNTNGVVTSFRDGSYHAALDSFRNAPNGALAPLPQPTTICLDCHAQMRPRNIVERGASFLEPMDHAAAFTTMVNIGGRNVNNVGAVECAVCHTSPGNTWADGKFHAKIGAAVPTDCNVCHYVTMANTAASDVNRSPTFQMRHASAQVTTQNCQTCHTGALARGDDTPLAATLWSGGLFHPSASPQPTACLDCHLVSKPTATTQGTESYAFALGGTSTNGGQWMSHATTYVNGRDCALCHAADARASGSAWSLSAPFHPRVSNVTTCSVCHGTANGNGNVAGTRNNLPNGLTNSGTTSSAAGVTNTGIAAGTKDQIIHTDVNVTGHDCNFCHTQVGSSTTTGIAGKEWAQADFHVRFNAQNPLVMNGTTGRCSNCHLNLRPGASYPVSHAAFTNASGSTDCSSCHSWPGTGTAAAPNWRGAAGGFPQFITVGGFLIPQPPAANGTTTQTGISNLPHPSTTNVSCSACHTGGVGGKNAIGYDHASSLINRKCKSCHEAGSNLVSPVWNGSTTENGGLGDTRPITLATLVYDGCTIRSTSHFYPVDCYECHNAPTGVVTGATNVTTLQSRWRMPHNEGRMTQPSTCNLCHGSPNNCPK